MNNREVEGEWVVVRSFSIFCSIYLAVAVQSSVIVSEWPAGCRPFLPALVLVAIAFWSNGAAAVAWSASVGLLLDGLSLERLGVQLAWATLLGCGLQVAIANVRSSGPITWVGMVFAVAMVWRVVLPLGLGFLDGRSVDAAGVLAIAIVEAAATAGLAAAIVCGDRWVLGSSRRVIA